jgi:hypothetical protein
MAFVIHSVTIKSKTNDLPDDIQVVASHLNRQFNNASIFIDTKREKRFDNNIMTSIYNYKSLRQHAVYLTRPDTYISACMLLQEAPTAVRVYLDTIGLTKKH